MWLLKSKEEKARINEGLELLAEKEAAEAIELEKTKYLKNYLDRANVYKKEIDVIRKRIANAEIKPDSDFEKLYILLTGINNRIHNLLGDTPEGWPKMTQLPTVVIYGMDAEAVNHAFDVSIQAENLKIHLTEHLEDLKIEKYDFYSEKFEIMFLVELKALLKKLKTICERLA